jgi:hypothetical protein
VRWVLCAVVWLLMMAAVVYVAGTEWGPVAVSLSGRHAVRWSEFGAMVLGLGLASTVTFVAWATSPTREQASVAVRWVLCSVVWVGVMVSSLYVASQTKLGPVVIAVSSRHGVHLSDVLVVLVGVAVATTFTLVAWATSPGRRSPSAARARGRSAVEDTGEVR